VVNDTTRLEEMIIITDALSNINRYSTSLVIKNMNVAEHSFRVAVYAMSIFDIVIENVRGSAQNMGMILRKALLHDFEESINGDISYLVKHYNKENEEFFKKIEVETIEERLFYYNEKYKEYMKEKDDLFTKIVKIADMLDVFVYAKRELTLGNKGARQLLDNGANFLVKIIGDDDRFSFILNYVECVRRSI